MLRVIVVTAIAAGMLASGAGGGASVSSLLLGISGDPARFQGQVGQRPSVHSFFLGWEQGLAWGKPFPKMLQLYGPIPMFHIGTKNRAKSEAITPRQLADGAGDRFLIALNHGIAEFGGTVFGRLMAEGNHCERNYAPFTCAGGSRGPQYAPHAHADAFARFFVILHGGTAASINANLRQRGLPPYAGPDLPANPAPRLRLIWNPLGGASPSIAANAFKQHYPGNAFVDIVGNDVYGSSSGWSSPQNAALYAFARAHRKPYAFPEWGVNRDDAPTFVQEICDFIRSKSAIVLASYYEAKAGSPWDLEPRPSSRDRYRRCITPLGR